MENGARCGITSSPAFSRAGIRSVPIGAQCSSIDKRIGDSIDDFVAIPSQEPSNDGCRSDPNQEYMIKADAVKTIFQCEHTLDFMCLDHRNKHVSNLPRFTSIADQPPAFVIGNRQDSSQVIGWMPPFCR